MLARSRGVFLVALFASAETSGCASLGPQVELVGVSPAQREPRIATVDLMPIATAVDVYPQHPLDRATAEAGCRGTILRSAIAELGSRWYRLGAVIDEGGRYSVGRVRQAMPAADVWETLDAVGRYAEAQRSSPRRLLAPALPHELGRASGSDATLFVGGTGYAGDEQTDEVELLEALEFLTLVSTGVGAVAAVASDGDPLERVARAAEITSTGLEQAEAIGAEVDRLRPVRYPPSRLRLTMTLVDNRSGAVLWHSDRAFRADPTNPVHVRRAVELAVRKLPCGDAPRRGRGRGDVLARPCRWRR